MSHAGAVTLLRAAGITELTTALSPKPVAVARTRNVVDGVAATDR